MFKWDNIDLLGALDENITPELRTLVIAKASASSRAVQDLTWVRLFASSHLTALRVTSNVKNSVQQWTATHTLEALNVLFDRHAPLEELSIFPNDRTERVGDPGIYDVESLLLQFPSLVRLALSAYQVDLESIRKFGDLPLRSLLIQGFEGYNTRYWKNLSQCSAPFDSLIELSVHGFSPVDVIKLFECRNLINGLLSVSLSLHGQTYAELRPLAECTGALAQFSVRLQDVTVEFEHQVEQQSNWLSRLAGLPLRRLRIVNYRFLSEGELEGCLGAWPTLESLSLPDYMVRLGEFSIFESCPNLNHLVLREIWGGQIPQFQRWSDQSLIVHCQFRIGRMSVQDAETVAR